MLPPIETLPHASQLSHLGHWLLVALQCPSHCRVIMCPGDISLCFHVDDMDKEKEARQEHEV